MLSKDARLRLFFDGLRSAIPAANHDEAFALIATTLNAVEGEHSGVPANPSNWQSDGRMYPPQADMAPVTRPSRRDRLSQPRTPHAYRRQRRVHHR